MSNGDPSKISIGVGWVSVAPLQTAEPVNASTALPSAWRPVGYTEDGWQIQFDRNFEDIPVAEEFDPIDVVQNRSVTTMGGQLAQVSARNLMLALDGLANYTDSAAAIDAPLPGAESGFMLVWDKYHIDNGPNDNNVRWLFRRAKSRSTMTVALRKSPQKALIPVEFVATVPTGARPWRCFPNADGLVF